MARLRPKLLALAGVLCALALAPPPSARGQALDDEEDPDGLAPAKRALIVRYIEATNTLGVYDQVVRSVTEKYQQRFPQVEKAFWTEFRAYHTEATDLYKRLLPVYAKHFTESDLKDVLAFLESPAGRKYTAVLPQVGMDVAKAAREFEIELNKKIIQKLRDSGY